MKEQCKAQQCESPPHTGLPAPGICPPPGVPPLHPLRCSREGSLAATPVVEAKGFTPQIGASPPPARALVREVAIPVLRGSSKVRCGGRCVCGPVLDFLFLALVLLSVPCGLYASVVAALVRPAGLAAVAIGLWAAAVLLLLRTSFTDPGILARNHGPPVVPSGRHLPQSLSVPCPRGSKLTWRWCDTCNLYRSPRASHCHICDNCVEGFDHHCPWTGTCIGHNNYRSFCLFLWTTNAAAAAFAVTTVSMWYTESEEQQQSVWDTAERQRWIPLALLLYLGVGAVGVSGLTLYHIYLVCTAQTTREHLKSLHVGESPWSQGALGNFCALLFSRTSMLPGVGRNEQLSKYVPCIAPYIYPYAQLAEEQLRSALHPR